MHGQTEKAGKIITIAAESQEERDGRVGRWEGDREREGRRGRSARVKLGGYALVKI